jgi:hypothetical protein
LQLYVPGVYGIAEHVPHLPVEGLNRVDPRILLRQPIDDQAVSLSFSCCEENPLTGLP